MVGTAEGAKHSVLILNPLTKRQYVRRSFVPFNSITIYNGYPDCPAKVVEEEWDVEQDPDQIDQVTPEEPATEFGRVTDDPPEIIATQP